MRNQRLPLSRPALVVAGVATLAGVASGIAWYLGRSDRVERHSPGTEAWIPHLVIAGVLAVWFVLAARRSPFGVRVVLSPLGRPISARLSATFRGAPATLLRCAAAAVLLFVQVYACWRAGEQVFAGLDPNFVHNAWGGPSYLGAMFCHYLDATLMVALCHLGLRAVTVRADGSQVRALDDIDRYHEDRQQDRS